MPNKWEITRGRIKHDALEEVKKVFCMPEWLNKLETWAGVRACRAVLFQRLSCAAEIKPKLSGLTNKKVISLSSKF